MREDDDTSLNWSSAGTRWDNPWGEIGVHIRLTGLAKTMRSQLEVSLQTAQAEKQASRFASIALLASS